MAMIVDITNVSTAPEVPIGTPYTNPTNGKKYRYIKVHASGVALQAGQWAYRYAIATKYVCSATPESLTAAAVGCTGVAISTIAVGSYGWVQTAGENTLAFTNNTGAGAATLGSVARACSTSGAVKWVVPTTNTEYTQHFMPIVALAQCSEASASTAASLLYSLGYMTVCTLQLD